MAVHKGSEGTVKIGSDSIGELKSFSVQHSSATIDTTTMGDTSVTRVAGLKSWSGSADAHWDEADAAQLAMLAGASVSITFAPEGATTGDTIYTGTAIVTNIDRTSTHDGVVEVSFTFEGDGDLTTDTVA